jgi:hypothetical protein
MREAEVEQYEMNQIIYSENDMYKLVINCLLFIEILSSTLFSPEKSVLLRRTTAGLGNFTISTHYVKIIYLKCKKEIVGRD